jgi:hypothetical protein
VRRRIAIRTLARVLAAALLVVASPALAQDESGGERVLVASFAGQLPGALSRAPERLTEAMAAAVGEAGSRVTRAPLDDVLAVAGCGEPSDNCLQQALALLEVSRAVVGEVEAADGGHIRVRLRVISRAHPARRRSLILAGDNAAALEAAFRPRAAAFWRDPDGAEVASPRPPAPATSTSTSTSRSTAPSAAERGEPAAPGADLTRGSPPRAGFSARRVDPLVWGVTAGGAGLMVVGGLLLMAAGSKQDQVDDAPTDTVADLEALADLEASGRKEARWGSALLVTGAATAAAGVVLVLKQGGDADRSPTAEIAVAPSPASRGLGALLTMTVRSAR